MENKENEARTPDCTPSELWEPSKRKVRRSVLREFDPLAPDSPVPLFTRQLVIQDDDVYEDAESSLSSYICTVNNSEHRTAPREYLLIPELKDCRPAQLLNDTIELSFKECLENVSQLNNSKNTIIDLKDSNGTVMLTPKQSQSDCQINETFEYSLHHEALECLENLPQLNNNKNTTIDLKDNVNKTFSINEDDSNDTIMLTPKQSQSDCQINKTFECLLHHETLECIENVPQLNNNENTTIDLKDNVNKTLSINEADSSGAVVPEKCLVSVQDNYTKTAIENDECVESADTHQIMFVDIPLDKTFEGFGTICSEDPLQFDPIHTIENIPVVVKEDINDSQAERFEDNDIFEILSNDNSSNKEQSELDKTLEATNDLQCYHVDNEAQDESKFKETSEREVTKNCKEDLSGEKCVNTPKKEKQVADRWPIEEQSKDQDAANYENVSLDKAKLKSGEDDELTGDALKSEEVKEITNNFPKKEEPGLDIPSELDDRQNKIQNDSQIGRITAIMTTDETQVTTDSVLVKVEPDKNNENEVDRLQMELNQLRQDNMRLDERIVLHTLNKEANSSTIRQYEKLVEDYQEHIRKQFKDICVIREQTIQLNRHLASTEMAFSELVEKYNKAKLAIEVYGRNEVAVTESLKNAEYDLAQLHVHYKEKEEECEQNIKKAQERVDQEAEAYKQNTAKLEAIIKRLEIKASFLDTAVKQKTEECQAMAALYDDLTYSQRS